MYHVMVSQSEVIVVENWDDVKAKKKKGFEVYSGSSSIKTANEMVQRLKEEKFNKPNT